MLNLPFWKIMVLGCSLTLFGGCSATSLRCGVDADSSFVELYGAPQHMSQNLRQFGNLCGFAYEEDQETVELNILGVE